MFIIILIGAGGFKKNGKQLKQPASKLTDDFGVSTQMACVVVCKHPSGWYG